MIMKNMFFVVPHTFEGVGLWSCLSVWIVWDGVQGSSDCWQLIIELIWTKNFTLSDLKLDADRSCCFIRGNTQRHFVGMSNSMLISTIQSYSVFIHLFFITFSCNL